MAATTPQEKPEGKILVDPMEPGERRACRKEPSPASRCKKRKRTDPRVGSIGHSPTVEKKRMQPFKNASIEHQRDG